MLAVTCPAAKPGGGRRLVTEKRIVGMAGTPAGFVLTIDCPCGEQHLLLVERPAPLAA